MTRKMLDRLNQQYEQYTDEELVGHVKEGEKEPVEYLLMKYSGLVKKIARSFYITGADSEDLIQEGMIGLYTAIREYDEGNNAKFSTFARLCIERKIYSAVTAAARKKHGPLNTYVSFYTPAYQNEEENEVALGDILEDKDTFSNPEEFVLDKERINMIEYGIDERLSELEKQVLGYYLDGVGYIDIANALDKSPKSIDNALQRIRKKLSDM